MRVAVIVPGFAADEQDMCIPVVADVLREMESRAHVLVLSLRHPEPGRRYRVQGHNVLALGGGTRAGVRRLPLLLHAVSALTAEHRRNPFSVIHGLWADEPGAVAVAAARMLAIPSVVSIMGGELVAFPEIHYGGRLSRINRRLSAYALAGADAVTAAAASTAQVETTRSNKCLGAPVIRLPFGVDPAAIESNSRPLSLAGSFRVLHVGSLTPVKGWPLLLRAVALARTLVPELHLHLVGEGPDGDDICELAATLGMSDAVTLHGQVNRARLGAFYRGADVLAVTSFHEMQPAVVLEAGLHELPVVGFAVGMLPDLAPDSARVVTRGDVRALGEALAGLADPHERSRLAASLSRRVHERYLARHTAEHLVGLYHRLATETERDTGRGRLRQVTDSVVKRVGFRGKGAS